MKNSSLIEESDLKTQLFRKINIYSSLCIIVIGLIGNLLITYIYASKKRRTNLNHVYLLCAAINDNIFLIIHLFEDTLKTYLDVYSIEKGNFLHMFNLVDKNIQCQLINYLRNILRFVSAYIVVAFTIQRLVIVFKPLTTRFKNNKSAWKTVLIIILISILFNIWVPFIFKINDENQMCDINPNFSSEYFYISLGFILLVLGIPMIIVLICNALIFTKIKKSEIKRKKLQLQIRSIKINNKDIILTRSPKSPNLNQFLNTPRLSKISSNSNNQFDKTKNKSKSSKKITIQLCLVSLSFFILYLPYLIGWFMNFYKIAFDSLSSVSKNKIFDMLQIAEILYIFYYGIKFYILYFTGYFTKTSKFIFID
jgi:hypothetical protein